MRSDDLLRDGGRWLLPGGSLPLAWPEQQQAFPLLSPVASAGLRLSPAQLDNQLTLAMRGDIARYYDGTLVSDDELHPLSTRNVCLRTGVRLCPRGRTDRPPLA